MENLEEKAEEAGEFARKPAVKKRRLRKIELMKLQIIELPRYFLLSRKF